MRKISGESIDSMLAVLMPSLVFLLVVQAMFGFVTSPPIGDDFARVVGQANTFGTDFAAFMQGQLGDRPVLMLLIWAGLRIHGLDFMGFKLTSILLHASNAAFLYVLALKLAEYSGQRITPLRRGISAAVVLTWALCPIQWSSIVSIIQVGVPLSFFFGLATFFFFLRYARTEAPKYLLLMAGLFALSLLTKGTTAPLPLLFLAFRGTDARSRRIVRNTVGATAFTAILYVLFAALADSHYIPPQMPYVVYLMAQVKIFFWSFPHALGDRAFHFMYDTRPFWEEGIPNGTWLGGAIVVVALVLSAAAGRLGPAAYALGAYVLLILPESLIQLPDLYFDHRLSLPAGFAALILLAVVPERTVRWGRPLAFSLIGLFTAGAAWGAFRSERLANAIDSPEKYLFWEITGPVHEKDYALFAIVQNLDNFPPRSYYEGVGLRALAVLHERYPASPIYPMKLDYALFTRQHRLRAPPSLANEAFRRMVLGLVGDSPNMSIEVPLSIYCNVHRFPVLSESRLKRFLLLLAMGKVMEANESAFNVPAMAELPTVRYFWAQLSYDLEYFERDPFTPEERRHLGVDSKVFGLFARELETLAPGLPGAEGFLRKHRDLFR